jgi:hypothetical protein
MFAPPMPYLFCTNITGEAAVKAVIEVVVAMAVPSVGFAEMNREPSSTPWFGP